MGYGTAHPRRDLSYSRLPVMWLVYRTAPVHLVLHCWERIGLLERRRAWRVPAHASKSHPSAYPPRRAVSSSRTRMDCARVSPWASSAVAAAAIAFQSDQPLEQELLRRLEAKDGALHPPPSVAVAVLAIAAWASPSTSLFEGNSFSLRWRRWLSRGLV